jgi:hypothetical protein
MLESGKSKWRAEVCTGGEELREPSILPVVSALSDPTLWEGGGCDIK